VSRRGDRATAWARLLRLPNLFTAVADPAAGIALAAGAVPGPGAVASLVAASICLYGGGVVLNDWFDRVVDREERPGRPLPAGEITPWAAATVGFSLLGLGVALATAVAPACGAIAGAIALLAAAYDAGLKRSAWMGGTAMAGCRYLNLLMGAAVAGLTPVSWILPLPLALLVVAAMEVSRTEATGGDPRGAQGGLIGLAAAAAAVVALAVGPLRLHALAALLPLALPLPALITALREPTPPRLQGAVGRILLAIIPLDAALCLGGDRPWAAIAILALLPPARLLARRIPMS